MTAEEYKDLLKLPAERDARHYAWLRHLLLVAGGALALLAGLGSTGTCGTGTLAWWSLRTAWVALGAGILLLAYAAHGEVWSASEVARRIGRQIPRNIPLAHVTIAPFSVSLPWRYKAATSAGCVALCVAVVALVCHGLLR